MQKIIALAFVASALVAFPVATPSFAGNPSLSAFCGPDAPEAYKRAGGYCEQIASNDSLIESEDCRALPVMNPLVPSKELLVAENCGYYYEPLPL